MTNKEKAELVINSIMVDIPKGKIPMKDLIKDVKVKVAYFNLKECLKPKGKRTIGEEFEVKEIEHDFGFIFNDGTEIRHVEKCVYNYVDAEIIRKRERI
jgi:hypothetical protein